MDPIQRDALVRLRYGSRTYLPDGSVKESLPETFEFIFGVERQPATIETVLEGAKVGDTFTVHLPAEEIYGKHDPSLIRKIPKKGLIKQRLKEGQFYRQMKKGTLVSFKVVEIGAEHVLADFNKPLAGITVSMDLEVLRVRPATKKEINAAMDAQLKRSIGCG